MLSGFTNATATFYSEEQTGTEVDPYGDETPVYDWAPQYEDVPARAEQQAAEYVRDVYGEWPAEVYRLFVDPLAIGDMTAGDYSLGIAADDRVELGPVDGRFSIQPPNLQRLDSSVPKIVQLEVTKIE